MQSEKYNILFQRLLSIFSIERKPAPTYASLDMILSIHRNKLDDIVEENLRILYTLNSMKGLRVIIMMLPPNTTSDIIGYWSRLVEGRLIWQKELTRLEGCAVENCISFRLLDLSVERAGQIDQNNTSVPYA